MLIKLGSHTETRGKEHKKGERKGGASHTIGNNYVKKKYRNIRRKKTMDEAAKWNNLVGIKQGKEKEGKGKLRGTQTSR